MAELNRLTHPKRKRKPDPEPTERLILEVPLNGNLDKVLRMIATGLTRDGDSTEVLAAIQQLDRKVDTMSSSIDRIEKEAKDAAENVGLVRTAVENLKTVSEEMKTEITSLREQLAKNQLDDARLAEAAATFEKADDDMDAIVLPPAPPEGSGETGGETGGGTGG